jgi:hypothetical protein
MNRARRFVAVLLVAPAAACTAILGATDVPDPAEASGGADATTQSDSAGNDSAIHDGGLADTSPPDAGDADAGNSVDGGRVAYAAQVLADNPLGYWRLGDPDGSVAVDQVGTYPGNDPGHYSGDILYQQPGAILTDPSNKGVYLDPHDQGSYVSVNTGLSAVTQFPGQQPYTLEVWIQPTTIDTAYRGVLSNEIEGGAGKEGYGLYVGGFSTGAGIGFDRFGSGGSTPVRDASAVALGSGWHYVVVTYGGAQDSTIDLYVDGALAAHGATALQGQSFSGCTFDIGSSLCDTGSSFRGYVDEVAVYPVALDAGTIQAHYTAATQ